MISLAFIGLALTISGPEPGGTEMIFAPPACAYSVTFPTHASVSENTSDQDHTTSADLVRDDTRYAAACIGSAGPASVPKESDAKTRIEDMVQALGVQGTVHPLDQLGPDCDEVEGALGYSSGAYRIDAKLCVTGASTFIAETIYRAGAQDPAVQIFLASVHAK